MLILNNAETLDFSCQDLLNQEELSPEINKERWLEDKVSNLVEDLTEEVAVASAVVASEVETEADVSFQTLTFSPWWKRWLR